MKPQFSINLLGRSVPPKAKRTRIYWAFVAYLCLSGLLLVLECNLLTVRFIRRQVNADELQRLTHEFQRTYPDQPSAGAYANHLAQQLDAEAVKLDAIQRLLRNRVEAAPILAGLMASLPRDMQMGDLSLDATQSTVLFDILAAPGDQTPRVQPSELTEAWNADSLLTPYLGSVETLLSERRRVRGSEQQVYRFSAKLAGGGQQ